LLTTAQRLPAAAQQLHAGQPFAQKPVLFFQKPVLYKKKALLYKKKPVLFTEKAAPHKKTAIAADRFQQPWNGILLPFVFTSNKQEI